VAFLSVTTPSFWRAASLMYTVRHRHQFILLREFKFAIINPVAVNYQGCVIRKIFCYFTLSSARRAAMQCTNCQTENPETNKFCRKCGTRLILVCPQCRSTILPDDRFCGHCGNQLAVTPVPAQLLESNEGNEITSPSHESVALLLHISKPTPWSL
jgi:hypothetical protein